MKLFRYIMIIAILNFLDGIFTFFGIYNGFVEEKNPIMAYLYNIHPLLFIGVKTGLSIILIFIGRSLVKKELVFKFWKQTLIAISVLYSAILIHHFAWMYIVFA